MGTLSEKHIVILAAGDFPRAAAPLRALREADLRICCDSAAEALVAHGLEPDRIVGDLDSLSPAFRKRFADRITHISEQDDNDLTKAFHLSLPLSPSRITIVGATGRREDHTLGNISLLLDYAREAACPVTMLTDYGRFVAIRGECTFSSFPRQQVSVFTMTPDVPIASKGLKWELDGFHARRWWQATLNEALGTEFSLSTEGWLVIFQTYEAKS